MGRLISAASLWLLAVVAGLMASAALRLGPVHAAAPLDVTVVPLLAAAVPLAALAACGAAGARRRAWRGPLVGLLASGAALALVVALRGGGGLEAEVDSPRGRLGTLPRGPIGLVGLDLGDLPPSRRRQVSWRGALRAPLTGGYAFRASGAGRLTLRLDGVTVLDGQPLPAAAEVPMSAGERRIEVVLDHAGPSPRLALEWSPPAEAGGPPGGRFAEIPPRRLGPASPAALWWLTDLLALAIAVQVALLAWRLPWAAPRRPPAPRPVTPGQVAASLAGYALLAVVMTWPLASDPARLGVVDRPDGRLNVWILAWDVHALTGGTADIFDAPAFHPLPDALAFSENLLLMSVLAIPGTLLGGAVLGYNAAWMLSLVVSGLGAELLVRRVSGDRLAAFAAGALFAFGAHRWSNTAHLHAHATLFLPLALLGLDRFLARPGVGRGLVVGLLVALQGLASVYLGAITAAAVALLAVLAFAVAPRPGRLLKLAPGALLAAALLAPVAVPYLRMRAFEGAEFDLEAVTRYATTPESWLASGAWPWFEATRRHLPPERVRDPLFPGAVPLLLGLAGLAAAPRRYRGAALALAVASFVLSLGPATPVYRWLHEHVVLFRGIRALARFSVLPTLALAVLAGIAVSGRRRAPALALALGLVEAWSAPLSLGRWDGPSPLSRHLAGGRGAVIDLPLGAGDTAAMLDATAHFRPLVNGDSGFIPRPYTRAMELLEEGVSAEGLRFLRAVDVTRVISAQPAAALRELERSDGRVLLAVSEGPLAEVPEAAPARPTRWTAGGALIDLGGVETVSRVTFETSEAPWVAAPRLEVSRDGRHWRAVAASASLADATLALYRDPRRGCGELRFGPVEARFLRLDPRLPARPGALGAE